MRIHLEKFGHGLEAEKECFLGQQTRIKPIG